MYYVSAEHLENIIRMTLHRHGLSDEHAEYVVQGLIEPSLRGIDTHGVRLFETYIKELEGGRSAVSPQIQIRYSTASVVCVDAGNALGLVAGRVASQLAVETARTTGIAAVAVRNSNHYGAASYYTLSIAREGFIGMSFTNSDALVAPHNGRLKLFGTNPISFAVTASGGEKFCLDMATSQVSFSRILEYIRVGRQLEPGWAIDDHGDDAAVSHNAASLLPLGGYKGQGLAMMVEILTSLLTGMPYDHEASHLYAEPYDIPRKVSHFFIALDIECFTNSALFRDRLRTLIEVTRQNAAKGEEPVRVPGDLEEEEVCRRRETGIPLTRKEFEFFQSCADELGFPLQKQESSGISL